MDAILILLIITIQFAIVYYSTKCLSSLNNKIIALNEKVLLIQPQISPKAQKIRNIFHTINNFFEKFYKNQSKIKMLRNLILLKSFVVAIIIYKKRKNIISFFSLYNIISKFTQSLLELK